MEVKIKICFLVPAFLGGADQTGQWRTPPFKAELRRWWRVVYAASQSFDIDVEEMRKREGMLFGNAWLSRKVGNKSNKTVQDHCKSLVRIKLSGWEKGRLTSWNRLDTDRIVHPEVERTNYKVWPYSYLGYGPLSATKSDGSRLIHKPVIDAGEDTRLSIKVPEEYVAEIEAALYLMSSFGSVGGRSHNGWGSFVLEPLGASHLPKVELNKFFRNWKNALNLDWPHALGGDESGPLIWRTAPRNSWQEVMRDLAIVKIGLRTQLKFSFNEIGGDKEIIRKIRGEKAIVGVKHEKPQYRHWLAYPVTNHPVVSWDRTKSSWNESEKLSRLPNSLHFTVRPVKNSDGQLRGVIYHMPWSPPSSFKPDKQQIVQVWKQVHRFLDELTTPSGKRRYPENIRKNEQIKDLDSVTLIRQGGNRS